MALLPFLLPWLSRCTRLASRAGIVLPLTLLPLTETAAQPPSTQAAAGAATVRTGGSTRVALPLSRLVGDDKPVRLSGVASSMKLSLPIPALWQAQAVELELAGAASRALTPVSQLEITVNGRVIQTFTLDGTQASFRHKITVPVDLLRPGFNDVQLTVAQHYTDRCEYPMATQLWTDIDLRSSSFTVTVTPQALPARLDRLDALFDKAVLAETPTVSVLTAQAPAGPVLTAAGLIAQGVGQRYDYVPVRMTSGRFPAELSQLGAAMPEGARAALVLGTFASLASYLTGWNIPTDAGPVVAIRPLPEDPTRFAVVLAAATPDELPLAAAAFAMQRMPWPGLPWVTIRELRLPPPQTITSVAATLKPSTQAFAFKALGYRSTTYSGLSSTGATLRFWNTHWQGRAQVRLHLGYASGMASQSALNVLTNGVMHGTIPLNSPAGGVYENQAVSVPSGALRQGWNTLELQPVLVPQTTGGDCKPFFPGNLAVTVYDDSTLQTFGGSALMRPDLGLLARDARAAPGTPAGLGVALQLTDTEDATVGAGLTLMAKLAQVFEGPLLHTRLGVGADDKAGNRIWVGTLARLPDAVRQRAGLGASDGLKLGVPLIQSVQMPVREGSETLMHLRDALEGSAAQPTTVAAEVVMGDLFSQHTVATTVFDNDNLLTVFTAIDPATLQAGLHDLVDYGQWAQLRGSLAFWRPGEPVRAIVAEDTPFTAYSLRGGVGLWVSQYPWWSLAIVLSMVILMVTLTRVIQAGYRRRHLPAQTKQQPQGEGKA